LALYLKLQNGFSYVHNIFGGKGLDDNSRAFFYWFEQLRIKPLPRCMHVPEENERERGI